MTNHYDSANRGPCDGAPTRRLDPKRLADWLTHSPRHAQEI
jgi:hypothetical protein